MTQRFDDMADFRPKPTFPEDAPWGPMRGAFYRITLYDDKATAALRSRKAYQEQALRLAEAKRQEVKPGND
jgi:hypothetical protein